MTNKELRIGNYVKLFLNNSDYNVIQIRIDDLYYINQKNGIYEPILLTEEWLEKFGFERNENGLFKLFNQSEVPILLNEDLNGWTCDGINFSINNTQYVHQLQNLYFILTGEELKLN